MKKTNYRTGRTVPRTGRTVPICDYLHLEFRDCHISRRGVANAWYAAVARPIGMSSRCSRIGAFGLRSYGPHLCYP
jgi:hypothetical protein